MKHNSGGKSQERRITRKTNKLVNYAQKRAKYVSKGGNAGKYDSKHKRLTGRLAKKIKKHGLKIIKMGG